MPKIKSFQQLKELYDSLQYLKKLHDGTSVNNTCNNLNKYSRLISVCSGSYCESSEGSKIFNSLMNSIKRFGLKNSIKISLTGCLGFCENGPIIHILPDDTFYIKVKPEDIDEIIESHLLNNKIVERLLYMEPALQKNVIQKSEIPFYKKQLRIALRNCGVINPEDIKDSISEMGYFALGKILTSMIPEEVITLISQCKLRERVGGGFPTGSKWQFAKQYNSDKKYIICNAGESDPDSFIDHSILEGDPHSILEAMAIAGYAIGANKGEIYIESKYTLAIKRLKKALKDAYDYSLLGKNILSTDFSFDIHIKYGTEYFIYRKEPALIDSIEENPNEYIAKSSFAKKNVLLNNSACINNTETLALIPTIINNGIHCFKSIGTKTSRGTKVFALSGKVNNVGLVEVPMGTTLREIIYDIGGGMKNGRRFKAIQIGDSSGGCIPESYLDTHIDYESLTSMGSITGSGKLIVMDEDTCMVNIAKSHLEFCVNKSCNKCTSCRIDNKKLLEIVTRISEGNGIEKDLEVLKELSKKIKDTSLCGLGQVALNPLLSTITYFWNEYESHVKEKRCIAGICKNLV